MSDVATATGAALGTFAIPAIVLSLGLAKADASAGRAVVIWGFALFLIYAGYIGGGRVLSPGPIVGWTCALILGIWLTIRARKQPQT
ncbi:hypothetical protein GCM10027431_32570 [Lysobacter rhizosphaerae]